VPPPNASDKVALSPSVIVLRSSDAEKVAAWLVPSAPQHPARNSAISSKVVRTGLPDHRLRVCPQGRSGPGDGQKEPATQAQICARPGSTSTLAGRRSNFTITVIYSCPCGPRRASSGCLRAGVAPVENTQLETTLYGQPKPGFVRRSGPRLTAGGPAQGERLRR